MNTQKALVIANPCHANWDKMSQTEKGRFCASCTKEVVDFTQKSKPEIIHYLENYQGEGQTCGQFNSTQIDTVGKTYINSSFFKRVGISFMAFLGFMSLSKESKAQKGKVAIKGDVSYKEWNEADQKMDVTVFGSVRTLSGEKIASAEVIFNHDGKQLAVTKTIANGTFAIQLKVDKSMKAITMYTSANGYERKINVIPNPQKEKIKIDIIMESEIMVLGQIAIRIDTIQPDPLIKESILEVKDTTTCTGNQTIEKDSSVLENIESLENTTNDTSQLIHKIDMIEEKKWLNVYPNPTSDNATIEWKNEEEGKVEIFDINGKMVWSTNTKGNKTVFNTSNLANGNYIVKITSKLSGKSESAQLSVFH